MTINIKINLKNKHNIINIDKNYLNINITKLNNFKISSCILVCPINKNAYLNVTPQKIQWVNVNNPIIYHVESNTNWKIK